MKKELVELLNIRNSIEAWKIPKQDFFNNVVLDVLSGILLDFLRKNDFGITSIVYILKEVFIQYINVKRVLWAYRTVFNLNDIAIHLL